MTLSFEVNGVAVPEEAVLIVGSTIGGVQGLPSSAWYGEPSTATIIVDDPFGDYDFRAWEVFTADESAATGKTRVFTGWIFNMTVSRGPLPYKHAAARVWQLDVIDQNACLSFEVFRANSAQRPDETDLARIEFILESAPMAGTPVVAGTLTNLTDDPRNLQSADFVRQKPVEAFTSTAGQSGKSFYVFWNQTTERLELFYDVISDYPAATAAISNLMADEGPGVFYPFLDAELRRNGEDIYTGELLDFVGGSVYQRNAATIDRLSPTPLSPINFLRDFMRRSDQIGRFDTANAIVVEDLAGHGTEEDTITVTIRVPAANVNDIEAGQRVTVTFSHLVGYETPTDVNCIKRNVVPTAGRVDTYDVYLELSNKAKLRDLDGGDPDELPPDPVSCDVDDIAIVQSDAASITSPASGTVEGASWPAPPTAGNLLICAWTARGNQLPNTVGSMTGWTLVERDVDFTGVGGSGGAVSVFWKIAEASEDTTPQAVGNTWAAGQLDDNQNYLIEVAGVDSFDSFESGSGEIDTTTPGVTITPTAGLVAFIITVAEFHQVTGGGTPKAGVTELFSGPNISDGGNPDRWIGYMKIDGTTGSYDANTLLASGKKWAAITTAFYCSGSDPDAPCIATGQPSQDDEPVTPAPDGVETEFFTRCPFADFTLHVYVDNTDQTGAVTSFDGAAGSFVLGFAPTPTERITVFYLGR